MKVQWGKSKKDNSLSLLHVEAGSCAAETAAGTFQANTVLAVGGNAGTVAMLSSILNLVLAVTLIKVPSLVSNKQNAIKRTTSIISFINVFTWLPLIFAMLLGAHVSPILIIALWVINMVPAVLVYPLRDHWLASIAPTENMGRYLSIRSIISGIAYLIPYLAMGWFIQMTGNHARSYTIVIVLGLVAAAI
ncbi:MAG TPA: hypothetical protein VEH58_03415, partial [Dehalococcoidales bacterium]|nr:hypothetical protein [Dehalococcoidales bacterium]